MILLVPLHMAGTQPSPHQVQTRVRPRQLLACDLPRLGIHASVQGLHAKAH